MLGASQDREAGGSPWSHPSRIVAAQTFPMRMVVMVKMLPSARWEQQFATLAAHWNLPQCFFKNTVSEPHPTAGIWEL